MPGRGTPPTTIATLTELRERVPAIVERINRDPGLAAAAATNPLLALEELGEHLGSSLAREVERRMRFSRADAKHLEALARAINRAAGRSCRLDDPEQLARLLFVELALQPPGSWTPRKSSRAEQTSRAQKSGSPAQATSHSRAVSEEVESVSPQLVRLVEPLPVRAPLDEKTRPDPLAPMTGRHPVIEPLLAYRRLEATQPRLASPELYRAVRTGAQSLPVSNLRARLRTTRSDA